MNVAAKYALWRCRYSKVNLAKQERKIFCDELFVHEKIFSRYSKIPHSGAEDFSIHNSQLFASSSTRHNSQFGLALSKLMQQKGWKVKSEDLRGKSEELRGKREESTRQLIMNFDELMSLRIIVNYELKKRAA